MATTKKQDAKPQGKRKVLVLVDCWAGKSGQVVELDGGEVARLLEEGCGDDTPANIAAHE